MAAQDPKAVGGQPEHTYRVIRLVATSTESWEDAARRGVAEAAKTIINLQQAKVTDMDVTIRDDEAAQYRVKLELEFQVDRTRRNPITGLADVVVRRYLIVANETLAGDRIPVLVSAHMGEGPSEFHILVPATRSRETRRLTAVAGDPLSGYAVVDTVGLEEAIARDRAAAQERLDTFILRLADLGADFTSEIGGPDPFYSIAQVMERASFDEIIISTLPSSVSRWLRIDLPSRVKRAYPLPVETITVEN
ncbi:MAG: dodecin domain-containing protein [Actinomycetia bacterium]|nr:dodecin domain-containing protein [Actinomycetes bacterium]MCP4222036.1 dodecin domain-containing protein [Actinomycetes bacterium]MCP5032207.1 dodecin domain-containing protein [Actinomycetes bacterium]